MLKQIIKKQIQQEGPLSFFDFMNLALYHPEHGYYTAGLPVFGAKGDFITAPLLTPLFGQTIAKQCEPILKRLPVPCIFEFGAGSGQLCVDVLSYLEKLHALPQHYWILEVSSALQARQRALFAEKIPHLLAKIHWCTRWPTEPFNGVILANEVLDAMPVYRFLQSQQGLLESYIVLNDKAELQEQFLPANERLQQYVQTVLNIENTPYLSEANLFVAGWLQQCAKCLTQGVCFILDYGFPRHEYYHPDRHQGTLMCHYQHRAQVDPLQHIGEQDITAHVDFTQVAEAAVAAGFEVAGYTSQASFLLSNGLLSLLEAIPQGHERIKAQQAVKMLLNPHEMGELFKVIALTKAWDDPLQGFLLQDRRASL